MMTEPVKKYRSTISESFLALNLDKEVKILDVACGIGVVAEEIRPHGYTNIDGLDPVEGYLQVAQEKKLYKKVFKNFIDVRIPTPIDDETYDVIICCAGFFQSLISPLAFTELIRITKKEGILMWNIADGYEHYGRDYAKYDEIVDDLVKTSKWEYFRPIEKFESLVFTDSGAAYLNGYYSAGLATTGYLYCMKKL